MGMTDSPVNGPAPKTTPRRFIAGAKCPACGLEDKIVLYTVGEQKFYECVKCGHKEVEAPVAASKPLAKADSAEQILSFQPAPKKR